MLLQICCDCYDLRFHLMSPWKFTILGNVTTCDNLTRCQNWQGVRFPLSPLMLKCPVAIHLCYECILLSLIDFNINCPWHKPGTLVNLIMPRLFLLLFLFHNSTSMLHIVDGDVDNMIYRCWFHDLLPRYCLFFLLFFLCYLRMSVHMAM